jgi:heme/copper-type cytochrome/quinol oxidase subunit 1
MFYTVQQINYILHHVIVSKSRITYFFNNWIYSTNHKRISINYFWFVLLAGVVGMVLATLIRIELAYPGIGILAGDNSQYLSIVSAHGVIMVFFMAMPLLFGFFTNFLLPTQLGVHDVAFPRMNSAAFWFLPASLIVLCQLVCVDRRYQRMNCFNMKELQSLLRKRFFFEILDNKILNTDLNNSLLALKLTLNSETNSNSMVNFNLNNLTTLSAQNNVFILFISKLNLVFNQVSLSIFIKLIVNIFNNLYFILSLCIKISYSLLKTLITSIGAIKRLYVSITEMFQNINTVYINIANEFQSTILDFYNYIFLLVTIDFRTLNKFSIINQNHVNTNVFDDNKNINYFVSKLCNADSFILTKFIENSSDKRFLKYENANIKFKVKVGNYTPKKPFESNFDYLLTLFNFKTTTGKKSLWLNSNFIQTTIKQKVKTWDRMFKKLEIEFIRETYLESSMDFYFYYFNLLKYTVIGSQFQTRWMSEIYFDNSFVNIFLNKTKQLMIWNNWKQLKLSREGWRCRMLVARNQQSLYKKYLNESDFIWVVEKNAKDLIPDWAMITPFSVRTRYTLIGKTDIGLWVVVFTLLSSIISCSNFLITYRYLSTLNNRKMRDARSFFSEAIITTCWMTILANPMLIFGILMLLSDRHWKTTFFDYSGGGDTVLFQHMFWFFGHPEVYIIIVPCFGFTNTILSFYLRKRISARASLMYSMYTIAFLGFFVWGHHMYMVGLSHTTRLLYSTLTVMISVPAATKLMHWFITFINSTLCFELPLLLIFSFIFFFITGGISGMCVAHTGMDILFHDTFYVIGHFHVLLAGSLMFAGFAGIYFYLPAIFGIRYNKFFAYTHYVYYTVGQLFTVIPMIWLGYSGMPRRVLDYPAVMGGWHSLSTSSHILTIAGILCFIFMLFDSLRKKKPYIIKTFGVGRYNTRLNFFLYETARHTYWRQKYMFYLNHKLDNSSMMYLNNDILRYTLNTDFNYYYLIKKITMLNYSFILQFILLLIIFIIYWLSDFMTIINFSIIYLLVISLFLLTSDSDILVSFLIVIDLSVFLVLMIYTIHLVKFLNSKLMYINIVKNVTLVAFSLIFIIGTISNYFNVDIYSNFSNSWIFFINYLNFYTINSSSFYSDMHLLRELYFSINILEFFLVSILLIQSLVFIYFILVLLYRLSYNNIILKQLNNINSLSSNSFFFYKTQNIFNQSYVPANSRVLKKNKYDSKTNNTLSNR